MSDQPLPNIPLPSGWAKNVKAAVLHVISLAHYAIVTARGLAANSTGLRGQVGEARAFHLGKHRCIMPP